MKIKRQLKVEQKQPAYNVYDIHSARYNEQAALNALLDELAAAVSNDEPMIDADANNGYNDQQITITVRGKSFAFIIGGPQVQAFDDFAKSIADEQGYEYELYHGTISNIK